jgi:hypothetical protein
MSGQKTIDKYQSIFPKADEERNSWAFSRQGHFDNFCLQTSLSLQIFGKGQTLTKALWKCGGPNRCGIKNPNQWGKPLDRRKS